MKYLQQIQNWIANLDSQIGDTKAEIEKRIKDNDDAVRYRQDLRELIDYVEKNEIPEGAKRAIEYCLNWNPYADKKQKDD